MRKLFEAFCEDLFYFNILLIPFGFLMGVMSQNIVEPLRLLLFVPLLLWLYYLRLSVKKLSIFLILTWLSCIVGILSPHPYIYTFFIGLMCSHSVRRRTSPESKLNLSLEVLEFPLFLLAVLHIAAGYLHIGFMRWFLYIQALSFLILAIVYTHLKGVNSELELASSTTLQATKTITGLVNKFLLCYIVIFVGFVCLFSLVPFDVVGRYIGGLIVLVLRRLFANIKSNGMSPAPTLLAPPEEALFDTSIPDAPRWLTFLENILIYVVNMLFVLMVLAFIIWFFIKLYRGFYGSREGKIIYKDGNSTVTSLERPKKSRVISKIKNPIRAKYFKIVNRYIKKGTLFKSMTPYEMDNRLRENIKPAEYEKIRYGQK